MNEKGLTPSAIEAEFERTAHIGRAINALAQAELVVASTEELAPQVTARLDQILREVLGQADS